MGAMDFQLGVKTESAFNVPATVDRFYEYESEGIAENYGRTEGDPLRVGSGYTRSDRFTPYFSGAAGTVQMAVLTKGFGWWLPHLMGGSATTGPTDVAAYTHTGVEGSLYGKSFTLQVNRPFHPSGTNQGFTYSGGKVASWTLSNAVDGNLLLDAECDFASVDTATTLATASYPTSMDNFSWAGGVIEVGGVGYDVTEFSLQVSNGLDTERRQIRQNTTKKEQTASRREASFSLSADFDSLAQRNRAAADTKAGAVASLRATWQGPAIISGAATTYPTFEVYMPAVRFDAWEGAVGGAEAISQSLSGAVRFDGTNSPLTVTYISADSVA